MHRLSRLPLLAVMAGLLLATGSMAFQPGERPQVADLSAVPAWGLPATALAPADRVVAESRLDAFARATGTHWSALEYAPASLSPGLAVGSGLDLGLAISDAGSAEAAARAFVSRNADLLGTDGARLESARVHAGLGKWSVQWPETVNGMEVLHSRVIVLLTGSGRVAAFGSTTYPSIASAPAPRILEADALRFARSHLEGLGLLDPAAKLTRAEVHGPFVLPVATGVNGRDVSGHTIFRASITAQDPPAAYEVDVDAVNGEILQRTDVLRYDFSGTATGSIDNPNWCAGPADWAVPHLFVTVTGAGTDTCDASGHFSIPFSGSQPETLKAEMKGSFCDIFNTNGSQAFYSAVIEPGVPAALYWNGVNARQDERDTYFHATAIHDFVKALDPSWTDLDYPLPANVNLQQNCNAFWDGQAINMFYEAGGCANTGTIGDVIIHEYTHGITDFMYGNNDPPSDIHEGNSDIGGNFVTNEHVVGPGFYTSDCVNGIRDSDNDLRWPDDLSGEGHHDGQIIAGFFWHSRENIIADLGYDAGAHEAAMLWHYARIMGLPSSQPAEVLWTFLIDDNDGNFDNGTPHYAALAQAATRHGFEVPEAFDNVVIHHTPMAFGSSPRGVPIPVQSMMYSFAGPLDPDSLRVYYRASGSGPFDNALFQPVGHDSLYQAFIPGQPMGSLVDYYVSATDAAGNRLRRPATGAYTFQVAFGADDFESAGSWTVGAPGDNATQGLWERCDPVGEKLVLWVQPEDDTTPDPGRQCYITGQYNGGEPLLTDADGRTTLLSPVYDLTGMIWAQLKYNRWFQTMNSFEGTMDVSISYDNGAHWSLLEHIQSVQNPSVWKTKQYNLTAPLGGFGLTRFKVVMFGMPNPSLDEGGLDDFIIMAADHGGPTGVEDHAASSTSLALRPMGANPASGWMRMEYAVPAAGPVSVVLYRADGSVVRNLVRGTVGAGVHQVTWDGCDGAGRGVPSGVYFARLTTVRGTDACRIVIAR